jgi:V8-like Glu-specific endopeptidase
MVLIVLREELEKITPLQTQSLGVGNANTTLVHASYAADRRFVLTGHFGCRVLREAGGLWFTDCDTQPASSGGPVLIQNDGELKLGAIMIGISNNSQSVAVPVSKWIDGAVVKTSCP